MKKFTISIDIKTILIKSFTDFFTAIQQEKQEKELQAGIEGNKTNQGCFKVVILKTVFLGFQRDSLKHTETMEKNPLPTKEIIDQEKAA